MRLFDVIVVETDKGVPTKIAGPRTLIIAENEAHAMTQYGVANADEIHKLKGAEVIAVPFGPR